MTARYRFEGANGHVIVLSPETEMDRLVLEAVMRHDQATIIVDRETDGRLEEVTLYARPTAH